MNKVCLSVWSLLCLSTMVFCADDRNNFALERHKEMNTIEGLIPEIHMSAGNPLIQLKFTDQLLDQPMAQISVLGLAHALKQTDETAAQILLAIMSDEQIENGTGIVVNTAKSLVCTIASYEQSPKNVLSSLGIVGLASCIKARRRALSLVDEETGYFSCNWNMSPNDWVDIMEICSNIALLADRTQESMWSNTLMSNPTAQNILWSLAYGRCCKDLAFPKVIFSAFPAEEKVKKAYLAVQIAYAHAAQEDYDQFHVWLQKSIATCPSWRSVLDMNKFRPEKDKNAQLYWFEKAKEIGWKDPQGLTDIGYAIVEAQQKEQSSEQQINFKDDIALILQYEKEDLYTYSIEA